MKKNQGFTLIEVIVVIAIMGILFSMAVFSFSNHYNMLNLNSTVDKMRTEMNWARNYAAVREKDCVVRIWPTDGEYQFVVKDDGGQEEIFGPPGEILKGDKVVIENGVGLAIANCASSNPCELTYDYSSEVWDEDDVEVTLSLSGQSDQTLVFDVVTGRVYVQ